MKRDCVWLSPELCSGCGRCVPACPKGLIAMRASPEGEAAAIEHPERCAACGSCRLVCPAGAIDVYKE